MAIPKAKRNAPATAASPDGSAAPRARPTASPSGMLCTVIAASIFPCVVIPPDPPLSRSAAASVSTISAPPAAMPTAAVKNDMLPQPSDSDCSIAGIMSDHTDAATIIPDAKPLNAADAFFPAPRRPVKNTAAAPAAVEFRNKLTDLVLYMLPLMETEGRYRVTLAVGCTGGRHRSVAMAEYLRRVLRQSGYAVSMEHRHLELG